MECTPTAQVLLPKGYSLSIKLNALCRAGVTHSMGKPSPERREGGREKETQGEEGQRDKGGETETETETGRGRERNSEERRVAIGNTQLTLDQPFLLWNTPEQRMKVSEALFVGVHEADVAAIRIIALVAAAL